MEKEIVKGQRFKKFGVLYEVVSNEGSYKNSDGAEYIDLIVTAVDNITNRGRGERLLNLRLK
jgi:hypothetical protein